MKNFELWFIVVLAYHAHGPAVNGQDTAPQAPYFSDPSIGYSSSVDPGSSDGYSDTLSERAGSYWSFRPDSSNNGTDTGPFPAHKPTNPPASARNQPPQAVPYHAQSVIYVQNGLLAGDDVTQGGDPTDKAIRFIGEDKSCVKMENFTVEDTCLFDPSTCHLSANGTRGFSMSVWLNLPNSFDTSTRYIFDTGGTETGRAGVAIFYSSSVTGSDFSLELHIVVSTGSHYWKTILNGFLQPYSWTNIGIRWSEDMEGSSGKIYGLQVFVDKVAVVWTRSPLVSASNDTSTSSTRPLWTVGCRLDGTGAMMGRLDELVVWYWRLTDAAGTQPDKPNKPDELGQLELLDGNVELTDRVVPCVDASCLPGDPAEPPAAYLQQNNGTETSDQQMAADLDTTPAVEGDCLKAVPATWHGDNMIYCVDTVQELKEAITATPDFKVSSFLHALIRIVDKAPDPLTADEVDYLYSTIVSEGLPRLNNEAILNSLNRQDTMDFMNIVYVISKLTEHDKYNEMWRSVEIDQQQAGLTKWNEICDKWLNVVAQGVASTDEGIVRRYRAANQTAAAIFKLQSEMVTGDVVYPNYNEMGDVMPDQRFWIDRNQTWSVVRDSLTIPMARVLAYQKYTPLTLMMKMHNIFDISVPGFIDQRVQGLDDISFTVNSRVLSFYTSGTIDDEVAVIGSPISFTLQHRSPQDDRPFMKAAVICARWIHPDNSTSIGAWDTDGCVLVGTDDGQSTCVCSDEGVYAVLIENYSPPDGIDQNWYDITLILYCVSILCLIIFMVIVVARNDLHYEMHFVHTNLAFAMMLALLFYATTIKAHREQAACVSVSIFQQYSYMAAYIWYALAVHYVSRGVITGRLGGVIFWYTLVGWGLPAVVTIVCVSTSIHLYGYGNRCFGSQEQNFLKIYIGVFLAICGLVLVMIAVGVCNLRDKRWASQNPEDWADMKASLLSLTLMWPWVTGVWFWAMLVYLIPQPYQIFDFLFELFNSFQGIEVLLLLGFCIPSFRGGLCCRRPKPKPTAADTLLRQEEQCATVQVDPYAQ